MVLLIPDAGAVAFPITGGTANSGYTQGGPATEGSSGRWRSPYVRNCTNFMTKSIGMRIDGNDAGKSAIQRMVQISNQWSVTHLHNIMKQVSVYL